MKKNVSLAIILLIILSIMPSFSFAKSNLIKNTTISLKSSETPKRVEVSFDLTEPIELSQGSSNIIYEYFAKDSNGNLESVHYKKDRTWSGYLNSYDNYPSGERKYSSGAEKNDAYSDEVPATTIYTSTKTNASIDVTAVTAVRVTVLRADGSGEQVIIYNDGTTSPIEKIEVPVANEDKNTGIRIESTTAEIPVNAVLIATKLTSGPIYEKASLVLTDVKDFIAFEIKIESDGVEIQPDGNIRVSIPIPENFSTSNLAVYRINDDGTKTYYSVTVVTKEGVKYATFEAEHFSTYVLADITEKEPEKDETPKTGVTQTTHYIIAITIISAIGIVAFNKKQS